MSEKAKEIWENIKERKMKPKSKWFFFWKDCFVWGLFLITTLVGALAISVIIFIVKDNDWDIYKYLDKSFLGYFLILMPYFWIIILFLLAFFAYFNYKKTRKGYLLSPYWVVLGSILISVILGWALFNLKVGSEIDKIFAKKLPYYRGTELYKKDFWSNPDRGLLAGKIISLENSDNFVIEDLEKKEWNIEGERIIWKNKVNKEIGENVKIIGTHLEEFKFRATEVRAWSCHCESCEAGNLGENSCESNDNSVKEDASEKKCNGKNKN
jgi:hypothetical protein